MKRFLVLFILAMAVVMSISLKIMAQEDDCPCGTDEDGKCIPCDE
jgi:hypothetical protein